MQQNHSLYGNYVRNNLLQGGQYQWPREGSKDDQAHPPIHPVKPLEPGE